MKKTIISLAVLAAASNIASAQSSVTIYGVVDAGIVSERGALAGSDVKLSSGVGSASRLGFRGTEDLGHGLSAVFVLESGFNVDTGTSDVSGSLFNRQAFAGLKSTTVGGLTFGRQYTPYYNTLSQVADPFGGGYAGTAKNLLPANVRTSNAIVYATPTVSGFNGDLSYSLGEQAGNNTAGRQIGASVAYVNGPLTARLAYNNRNSDAIAAGSSPASYPGSGRNLLLAANYDFAVAKAFLAYGEDKGFNSSVINGAIAATPQFKVNAFGAGNVTASTDSTDFIVGATAPVFTVGTIMASYVRKNDKTALNQDATQFGIGYLHALSKRTSAYVAFAKVKNNNGGSYTVGSNAEAGTGDKAFNLGLRHSF